MNNQMSLYKSVWAEARQRMTDWWAGKILDRPVASVDTVFHNLEYTLTHTFWGGEAFPVHRVYFGPMISKIFFGSEPRLFRFFKLLLDFWIGSGDLWPRFSQTEAKLPE